MGILREIIEKKAYNEILLKYCLDTYLELIEDAGSELKTLEITTTSDYTALYSSDHRTGEGKHATIILGVEDGEVKISVNIFDGKGTKIKDIVEPIETTKKAETVISNRIRKTVAFLVGINITA